QPALRERRVLDGVGYRELRAGGDSGRHHESFALAGAGIQAERVGNWRGARYGDEVRDRGAGGPASSHRGEDLEEPARADPEVALAWNGFPARLRKPAVLLKLLHALIAFHFAVADVDD